MACDTPHSLQWRRSPNRSPRLHPLRRLSPPFLSSVLSQETARGSRMFSQPSPFFLSPFASGVSHATPRRPDRSTPTFQKSSRRGWVPPLPGVFYLRTFAPVRALL